MERAKAAKPAVKLTKSTVEKLPVPAAGQAIYRDSELKGFGLRVTSGGARTYIVEKRIGGKVKRVKIGRADAALPTEKARKLAQEFLGTVAGGRNPIAEKAAAKAQTITLGEVLDDYLATRGDKLKPRTREQYRDLVEGRRKNGSPLAFADWRNQRIADITSGLVQRRHRELSDGHGPAWANLAMRVLRLLINYASLRFEDGAGKPLIAANPVKRLGQARLWNDVERRQTVLRVEDMPVWHEGLGAISGVGRDYLLLVLLTGLRRREAAALKWEDVDLVKTRTLTVRDTKNGRDHVLPLSTQLMELERRRAAVVAQYTKEREKDASAVESPFVFPGRKAGTCPTEPKTLTAAVAKACRIHTSVHDLRRTFATTAERLDISSYAVKRLLNHMIGSDVTAGYIVTDIERLSRPMQAISDFLFRAMGAAETNVVPMREAAHAARPEKFTETMRSRRQRERLKQGDPDYVEPAPPPEDGCDAMQPSTAGGSRQRGTPFRRDLALARTLMDLLAPPEGSQGPGAASEAVQAPARGFADILAMVRSEWQTRRHIQPDPSLPVLGDVQPTPGEMHATIAAGAKQARRLRKWSRSLPSDLLHNITVPIMGRDPPLQAVIEHLGHTFDLLSAIYKRRRGRPPGERAAAQGAACWLIWYADRHAPNAPEAKRREFVARGMRELGIPCPDAQDDRGDFNTWFAETEALARPGQEAEVGSELEGDSEYQAALARIEGKPLWRTTLRRQRYRKLFL